MNILYNELECAKIKSSVEREVTTVGEPDVKQNGTSKYKHNASEGRNLCITASNSKKLHDSA